MFNVSSYRERDLEQRVAVLISDTCTSLEVGDSKQVQGFFIINVFFLPDNFHDSTFLRKMEAMILVKESAN